LRRLGQRREIDKSGNPILKTGRSVLEGIGGGAVGGSRVNEGRVGVEERLVERAFHEFIKLFALIRSQYFPNFQAGILDYLADLVLAVGDDFLDGLVLILVEVQITIQPLEEILAQNFRRAGRPGSGGVGRAGGKNGIGEGDGGDMRF